MRECYRILIVDDEPYYQEVFSMILEEEGYGVFSASSMKEAVEILQKQDMDILITDLIMPGGSGLDLLRWTKNHDINIDIILVTAYGSVETAVDAMKNGAYGYFIKSNNPQGLLMDIRRLIEIKELKKENSYLKQQGKEMALLESQNDKFRQILSLCKKVASGTISVLITGESGVGKEVIARYIHERSSRWEGSFVPVNCQLYSDGILESELFGHERGAFTGAIAKRIGKFEEAHGGTLFLDEVGEIPGSTQVKLLRVLENRVVERMGSNKNIPVDIRLISATNRCMDKDQLILREDLLYRLNGIRIHLPALRERPEDIEPFIHFFIERFQREMKKRIRHIDKEAMTFLKRYSYPGNIRELKNIMERLVVLSDEGRIAYEDVLMYVQGGAASRSPEGGSLREVRGDFERRYIHQVLSKNEGDKEKSAQELQISRRQLLNKMTEYGLK